MPITPFDGAISERFENNNYLTILTKSNQIDETDNFLRKACFYCLGRFSGPVIHECGVTFQISRAYSMMERSLENFPMLAELMMDFCVHSSLF